MKKIIPLLCTICLFFSIATPVSAIGDSDMVRIGLYYGSTALSTANLENSVGSGYYFGYENGDSFVSLGSTSETQITMMKTQTMYLTGTTYSTSYSSSAQVIGVYHIKVASGLASFNDAKTMADGYSMGFPAYIDGDYQVRVGTFESRTEAETYMTSNGISGEITGTSSYGISVTKTGSSTLLFQYDCGANAVFMISPDTTGVSKPLTWFKGYKYYGDFRYQRIDGGDLVVSNFVTMDEYIMGILPYEMSSSWPLEALKAQAVCARSYSETISVTKHSSHNFDLCNSVCCQSYKGANSATDRTDQAVEETSGICAYYNGAIAETYYYASNGGAFEDVTNVWSSTANLPYLAAGLDPYEADVADSVSNYYWTETFTSAELTSILQGKGYNCGTIVDLQITQNTDVGNVFSIAFIDEYGNSYPFTRERARTTLGLNSQRYQINGEDGETGYYIDGYSTNVDSLEGLYVLDGSGGTEKLGSSTTYVITSSGTEALTASTVSSNTSGEFVITGSGNGHHIGMSQWGAYAMANRGYDYEQILKFYYAGIDLY